ncbi:hypothetical protein BJ912DRAFT_986104 [Pholiota molesta]|nr:hypothetical protein BJ912DRAFT_986104 [Pholiota molesta]
MSAPANIPNNGGPGPPNVNINAFVDAIMRQTLNQLPLAHVAQISAQLLNQVRAIVRRHTLALAGLLSAASLAVLLPSLAVVVVNALGFTSSGVLLGSLAAALQSSVYGALTGGAFSVVQAFAATAVVASPAVLAIGSILLAGGVGLFGWKLWKWYNNRGSNTGPGGDDDDGDGDDDDNEDQQKPTNENAVIPRASSFDFLNLFRRPPR